MGNGNSKQEYRGANRPETSRIVPDLEVLSRVPHGTYILARMSQKLIVQKQKTRLFIVNPLFVTNSLNFRSIVDYLHCVSIADLWVELNVNYTKGHVCTYPSHLDGA